MPVPCKYPVSLLRRGSCRMNDRLKHTEQGQRTDHSDREPGRTEISHYSPPPNIKFRRRHAGVEAGFGLLF
jgi:hypothetical protein